MVQPKSMKDKTITIALVISTLGLLGLTAFYAVWYMFGTFLAILGVVILGEYISIKQTGKTLSKRFSLEKGKKIMIVVMWIVALLLGLHF